MYMRARIYIFFLRTLTQRNEALTQRLVFFNFLFFFIFFYPCEKSVKVGKDIREEAISCFKDTGEGTIFKIAWPR